MKVRLNKAFSFSMLMDVKPGCWFRYEADLLYLRTEQVDEKREILCVDQFGRLKSFTPTTHVMATDGTWVEHGAEGDE